MTDIVERLRAGEPCVECCGDHCAVMEVRSGCLCAIAADTITALRAENERLRAALEIMSMMGGYTKLHPDETAPGVEQNTYSWGVSDGYKEMAEMARAALEERT